MFVISFAHAAIISLVRPRDRRSSAAPSFSSDSTYSRSFATLQILEDQARDRVGVGRHDRVLVQLLQRDVGEHALGGDPFGDALRGEARQPIARLLFVGLGEHLLEVAEPIRGPAQRRRQVHGPLIPARES
jgi:hypothetical protein